VCDAAGAIDFTRAPNIGTQRALRPGAGPAQHPAFSQHQPPQGYFHPGADERALVDAVLKLREMTASSRSPGSSLRAKLCAHSRNEKTGCTACIDVCSASAIRSDASRKGKTARASRRRAAWWWTPPVRGLRRLHHRVPQRRHGLCLPRHGGPGQTAAHLLTAYGHGRRPQRGAAAAQRRRGHRLVDELGRGASLSRRDRSLQGLPARVLPVAVWHTASVGLDLWLAAIAQGASQVWVLLTDEEAPEYRQALQEQMDVAQALLTGLGYAGQHLRC
jgi:NAD-dependent dihydropyrimidine dehydrogenase PreA subunit